jgi:predicted aspartyl protease
MNLVFVDVRVNGGRTLSFNLDTGLQTTILDSDQARQLGLALHDKTEVEVPGGTIELAVADGVSLALPGVEIRDPARADLTARRFRAQIPKPRSSLGPIEPTRVSS